MNIIREDFEDVVLLKLQGDLGKPEAESLQSQLEKMISDGRSRFVLDMEEVKFIDSFSIMMLLRMNREALGNGGAIKLLRPRSVVKRFLDIGKVLTLFDRFETTLDAVRSFKATVKPHAAQKSKPVHRLDHVGKRQQAVMLRLLEMLQEKGVLESQEFNTELNRSTQLVFDIFRKELEH